MAGPEAAHEDDVVRLDIGGRPVLVRMAGGASLPAVPAQGKYADTGRFADRVARGVEGLDDLVRGVAVALRDATAAVRPDEVSVSFGVELSVQAGAVVSLLAHSEAKATVTVNLTWRGGQRPGDPTPPEGE